MTLTRRLSYAALVLTTLTTACKGKERQLGQEFDAPALHQPQTVTLARRSRGEPDNYKDSCLFLNESFRRRNTCSLNLQSDFSLQGVQVVNQVAQISRGVEGESVHDANWPGEAPRGDEIKPVDLKVGSLWFLHKSDHQMEYELAFEVVRVTPNALTIRYEVKSFAFRKH